MVMAAFRMRVVQGARPLPGFESAAEHLQAGSTEARACCDGDGLTEAGLFRETRLSRAPPAGANIRERLILSLILVIVLIGTLSMRHGDRVMSCARGAARNGPAVATACGVGPGGHGASLSVGSASTLPVLHGSMQ